MTRLILAAFVVSIHLASAAQARQAAQSAALVSFDAAMSAPATVHVNALVLPLADGTPLTARYEWDFGDPGSRYNTLLGWNAAHTYDRAGTYAIGLTLTSESGVVRRFRQTIVVRPAAGRTVYVAADGNDAADGTSPKRALRSFWRALDLAGDGGRVFLLRGDRFDVAATTEITQRDLLIGSYSPAPVAVPTDLLLRAAVQPNPVIRYVGPRNGSPIIQTHRRASDVMIEDITFDTIYSRDAEKKNIPAAIRPLAQNLTVRRCIFLNVGDGVNSNAQPRGVLMQGCTAPLRAGLRGYLAWIEGADHAYLGNAAANSTREAVMRISYTGAQRVLIAGNLLTNLDRTDTDATDIAKNALTVHSGSHFYITGNTFAGGPVMIGPLGEGDGFGQPNQQNRWAVFENNLLRSSSLRVNHGMEKLMVRNNRFCTDAAAAINVEGYNGSYQRGSSDIRIVHNTAFNRSAKGMFLRVGGKVDGIDLVNNLYAAAELAPGSDSTAIVYVGQNDLSSFGRISGNIWPVTRPRNYAAGGAFYIWPKWSDPRGYKKLDRWNELAHADDSQRDVPLDERLRPTMMAKDLRRPPAAGAAYDAAGAKRDAQETMPGAWND